ncbi:MAG: patatin-like phospholipase family protein [Bacillota bacterium]
MPHLDPAELADLMPYLTETRHSPDAVILRQGEVGTSVHIIRSGEVEIYAEGDPRVLLATLGPGEVFGEMSCLTGAPTSATVQARGRLVTLATDRAGLDRLMAVSPAFRQHVVNSLVDRVRRTNQRVQDEHLKTAVMAEALQREGERRYGELVGQSEAMVGVREAISRLAGSMQSVAIIGEMGTGKDHVASRIHMSGPRAAGPLLRLSGSEFSWEAFERQARAAAGGTLVISDAHRLDLSALSRVLTAASEARLIMTAQRLPDLIGVEKIHLPPLRDRREDIPLLVRAFLRQFGVDHPDKAISAETVRHLMSYPFLDGNIKELQLVIREAAVVAAGKIHPEHIRLGRYRVPGARPKIGLALGAGAMRGGAHIGVLKVFEQEGVPIDLIAGTSIGAVIGGLYAGGVSIERLEQEFPRQKLSRLMRWVWPREAFLDNSPLGRLFERECGPVRIEELKIPFAAVAADARTGEPVVMRSGSLAMAVRASSAIPMVMKPVLHQGQELVDGGVVHKVPVLVARSMGADLVVAVQIDIPTYESGPARNLIDSFLHAYDITSERLVADELQWADVVLRPRSPVGGYNFKNAPIFIQRGEEEARKALPLIRQKLAQLAAPMD